MSVLALVDVRAKAAAALAPVDESDPNVHVDLVDALDPPCLLMSWADPMAEPKAGASGLGFCEARFAVICVAGRLEPGAGVEKLEGLVGLVVRRLQVDSDSWPLQQVTAPRVFEVAGIKYLAARVEYRVPVAL
jgi:hypothetical protein